MADGVFTIYDALSEQWYGYSANTGAKLWGPTVADNDPWGSEPSPWQSQIAYGILYGLASDGVRAFNLTTGKELWDFKGISSGTNFPGFSYYPFEQSAITVADGKLYLNTGVSHGDPVFDGAQLYCVNATTGKLIWNINNFAEGVMPISDGILVALNGYDNQVYAYGMGPSKTTINAPGVGVTTSTPVTITGAVTDISAGASQAAVAANFPNGLPCVSDASMTQFMESVYMQQPEPHNVTGVPVTFAVIDSNGNYRTIGSTTTNGLGDYSFAWKPDIAGNYTVYATFAGTNGYYGSTASTGFYASSPATTAPTATPLTGLASNNTLMYGIVAIIIVIIVGIVALAMMMLRKRP
jgi:outer membrane protein assembly factor BamB